jgi:hypothetical protein
MGAIRGLFLAILAAGQVRCHSGQTTTNLITFPKGYWIENIAMRSNRNLLLTRMDKAEIYEMNPLVHAPQPKLLHAFTDGNNSCMGIAKYSYVETNLTKVHFRFRT